MKTFQRILAVVLALVMSLSVIGVAAFAAEGDPVTTTATIDTTKTGSITVHKYEYNGNNKDTGTGEVQTPPEGAEALEDVTFTLYQVMNQADMLAYYNGTTSTAVTVDTYVTDGVINENVTIGNPVVLTTDEDGIVTFSDLALGMYVIIETDAPEKVTVPAAPFLVSVPMTDTNQSDWLYDINVYPKNSTSEGNVTLKKTDKKGSALENVNFTLEKKGDGDSWVLVEEAENDTTFTTNSSGEIAWNSLAHGTYRITETSAPAGYIVDKRPIEFTVTNENKITCYDTRACITLSGEDTAALTITLKNEKPDVTKTLADDKKEGTVDIGDTVSYKVTIDVPSNITSLKTFTLTDTPTNLQDTVSTVKVDDETDAESNMWSVEESDKGFIITFDPSAMGSVAGTTITVTYDAVVLASAADATAAPNTANLTYSNAIVPDGEPTPGNWQIEDGAVVYTYKLGVIKYKDAVDDNNKLADVEFSLYTSETGGTALKVVGSDGVYRLAIGNEEGTTTLVTNSNGTIVVKGLDNGTYYLEETKTASGYNLLQGRVEVELEISTTTTWNESSSFDNNGKLIKKTYSSATHTSDDNDAATTDLLNTTIINKKGFDLPQTGGIGTLMFILMGGVLIAGGICLIAVPNKKRSV